MYLIRKLFGMKQYAISITFITKNQEFINTILFNVFAFSRSQAYFKLFRKLSSIGFIFLEDYSIEIEEIG